MELGGCWPGVAFCWLLGGWLLLLELAGDGATYRLRDAVDLLAQRFALSQAELKEMLPSGYAPLFANRVVLESVSFNKS